MSKINVIISGVSENPTTNGNVIVKLVETTGKIQVLPGVFKEKKSTYYMAVDASAKPNLVIGAKHEFDMGLFEVKERPFNNPETNEEIMLKWLHLK